MSSTTAPSVPGAATGRLGAGDIIRDFERPPESVVARLARLPLANISDAMHKHGVLHHEVRPVVPGMTACGPALTCGTVDLTVKIFALGLARPGDVFVLAAGGIRDYACFGELASTILRQRGAAGAVVDGAARDLSGIREVGLPVFARSITPRNYHYPFGLPYGSVNEPVECAGIRVSPGDIVVAGDDGVVVVPRSIAAEVADAAEAIQREEDGMRSAIQSGSLPSEAMEEALQAAGYAVR